MTYQSQVLATRPTDLLALWMLNEAAGAAAAADLGPNNLPLTYTTSAGAAGKIDGTELVAGAGNGMAANTQWATRAVAAGSTLAPTAAATLNVWLNATTLRTSGSSAVIGRQNHLRAFAQPYGSVSGYAWGTVNDDLRVSQWCVAGKTYMLSVVVSGAVMRVYVNGKLLQRRVRSVALAAVADAFLVGASATQLDGTLQGAAMWKAALEQGELEELYREGTKVTPVEEGIAVNRLYDTTLPIVTAAPAGPRCGLCGGTRRTTEPTVLRGGRPFHPGCYQGEALAQTWVTPTSTSTAADYEKPVLSVLDLVMRSQASRVTDLAKPLYYDGTKMVGTGGLTGNYDTYGPWGLVGALVAWHRKLPAEHWMVQFAIATVERLWSIQTSQGNLVEGSYDGGADFVMSDLGEAIIILRRLGHISAETYDRWVKNFTALGNYYTTYPVSQPQSAYYVNGNREAAELHGYWALWLVTGDPKWKAQYEAQLTYLTTFETKVNATADSAGVRTYGWVTVVAPTAADGSDGKGYLVERTGSRVGSIVGPDGSTVLSGYDPNYSLFAAGILSRLWLTNRDPRILRMVNMLYNLLADRANQTTAAVGAVGVQNLDGTGGSRQTNVSTFGSPLLPTLGFAAGQSRVTPAMIAANFAETVRFWAADQVTATTLSRGLNTELATYLMTLPSWVNP